MSILAGMGRALRQLDYEKQVQYNYELILKTNTKIYLAEREVNNLDQCIHEKFEEIKALGFQNYSPVIFDMFYTKKIEEMNKLNEKKDQTVLNIITLLQYQKYLNKTNALMHKNFNIIKEEDPHIEISKLMLSDSKYLWEN